MSTFNFAPQTQAPAFGSPFSLAGSTSTTSTPSFASSSFSNPVTNVSGSGLAFGTNPTTSTSNIFGATTGFATTTAAPAFPALGQTTLTAAPSTGFNFGGFGTGNTGASFASGVPVAPTTSTTATVGLGGVDLQAPSINGTNISAKKDKAVKETFIPNELVATLDNFKNYIKEQKSTREEMSRLSNKNISRIQSQISTLKQQLSVISNGLQRNAIAIAKLKQESSEELRNAEIIRRTKDTPFSLQCENSAPVAYFDGLATSFENQMQSYRQQIEQLERHLVSLSQPSTMTPSELTVVMKRLHDAFVTLAAQLQTTHQQVQFQKDQFLALKKVNENDVLNIFCTRNSTPNKIVLSSGSLPIPVTVGPSPLLGSSATETAISSIKRQQLQGLCSGGGHLSLSLNSSNILSSSQLNNSFGMQSGSAFKPLGK